MKYKHIEMSEDYIASLSSRISNNENLFRRIMIESSIHHGESDFFREADLDLVINNYVRKVTWCDEKVKIYDFGMGIYEPHEEVQKMFPEEDFGFFKEKRVSLVYKRIEDVFFKEYEILNDSKLNLLKENKVKYV